MPTIELPYNWNPRHYQIDAWRYLAAGGKRAAFIWHRRAGKDDVALRWTSVAAMQAVGNYWHMLPNAKQARKALWDAINPRTGMRRIDEAFPPVLREVTRENEMFIRFLNGSTWQVVGSDNFDSLVGSPPIGLVFSEYAIGDPRAWQMLRPILLDNGGWAIFPYTPRGHNHGLALKRTAEEEPHWHLSIKTVDDTGIFDKGKLEAERRELIRENGSEDGQAIFEQEYHCSFNAAIRGAYYAKLIAQAESEGRITGVPYDANALVTTAWDIGIGDSTAIWWFQRVGRELHVIDYYETNGQDIAHYAGVINAKPYAYKEHLLPHDAKARELGTGKSTVEMLQGMGLRVRVIPNAVSRDDGIRAVKALLPTVWFDKTKCERGIECLRQYAASYDEERKVLSNEPRHDWTSHGADAFRMAALGLEQPKAEREPIARQARWVT